MSAMLTTPTLCSVVCEKLSCSVALKLRKMEENRGRPVYGDVCFKKQRRKRQKLLVIELLLDYAKNSTLHGLRYIAERGLTAIEKIFWLLTFLISVAMCFMLIRNVWVKWVTSPVIVSFSEQLVPVGMVPFPSVTICPQIKSKSTAFNFSDNFKIYVHEISPRVINGTADFNDTLAMEKLDDIGLICEPNSMLTTLNFSRPLGNVSVVAHIDEVSPKVSDVFRQCKWRGKSIDCEEKFRRVLTNEGVCYNYNALAADETFHTNSIQDNYTYIDSRKPSKGWSFSSGFSNDEESPYPERGRENGASPDMVVLLNELKEDKDGMCNSLNSGYKIYVQHPADFPHASLYYYAALPNQVSSLALKFNMLTTSDSLKNYKPEVRQCYFPNDRQLRYFKIYTADNCKLECQSNFTYEKCGCVAYYMPHNDSGAICTKIKNDCVNAAKNELADKEMKADLGRNSGACRCLPACDSVQYDAEILKTKFDLFTKIESVGSIFKVNMNDLHKYQFSKIEMYFKESRFVSMRRSELFGLTDFLANCGGLLGLFLGFSFLSLVEIIYFLTLRLCCTLKRDLQQERAERKDSSKRND